MNGWVLKAKSKMMPRNLDAKNRNLPRAPVLQLEQREAPPPRSLL